MIINIQGLISPKRHGAGCYWNLDSNRNNVMTYVLLMKENVEPV